MERFKQATILRRVSDLLHELKAEYQRGRCFELFQRKGKFAPQEDTENFRGVLAE